MTYKEALHKEMLQLASNPKVRFVGYNTKCGPQMNGTLKGCEASCIEMPVAENLMVGVAIGLALNGFLPVLCFERMDFMLAAADALFNHVGKLQHYGLTIPIIIRACVGNDHPLDPGWQHKQDYSPLFSYEPSIVSVRVLTVRGVQFYYGLAQGCKQPLLLTEYKELYEATD